MGGSGAQHLALVEGGATEAAQRSAGARAGQQHSDDELMLLARAGRRGAYDELVRRHQTRALAVAGKLVGDVDRAGDAVQNTFLQIYRGLDRYQPRGRFRSYLFAVLLSQCRMTQRRLRRERRRRAQLDEPPSQVLRPDECVLRQERMRIVDRAVRRLSRKLRTVVVLRYAGDLSIREIGELLGLPPGTVKSRLFAGLRKLRSSIGREGV
jgi:RNA polymerase sigma-70 factor (ECF subfamily)